MFGSSKEPCLYARYRVSLEKDINLLPKKGRGKGMDVMYFPRRLGHYGGHGGESMHAQQGEGFEIGLYSCSCRAIGPCDCQGDWRSGHGRRIASRLQGASNLVLGNEEETSKVRAGGILL